MAENIFITDTRNMPAINPWPYQVTEVEIACQFRKLKKMSFQRYEATLNMMLDQQPAIDAFLGSLPFVRLEFQKTERFTIALAIWLAYKVKFNGLPKVEDKCIGMDLSVVFDPSALGFLTISPSYGWSLIDTAYSLLPFTMMLNGLEAAVKPPQYPGSLGETFRKRIWIDNNHYLTKAAHDTAPDQ